MLAILDLLGGRGCVAPEDICNLGAVSSEWRAFATSEAVWLVLSRTVHLRPLPAALAGDSDEGWAKEPPAVKSQLLQEYIPTFAVRQRIRQLCRRLKGFWLLYAPHVAASLRPGATEAALRHAENEVNGELPEDLAEFYRLCDGFDKEALYFAEAAPGGVLAFRVTRLLPLSELVREKAAAGWLPVALCREGGMTCCRIHPEPREAEGAVGFFGELWSSAGSGRAERGIFGEWTLTRQTSCFLDYLQDYVSLLEGLPSQWAEQSLLTTGSLGGALVQLFSAPRIYCDEQGSWMTTGLGKGKGNLWQRLSRSQPVRVIFPPGLGKTGKRRASFAQSWLLEK